MIVKENCAGKYCVGMYIILFRNLKSIVKLDCLLHSLTDGQYIVCNISVILSLWFLSMICLIQTLQLGAVSFLASGRMLAGMDLI